jgi:hypothetical protein
MRGPGQRFQAKNQYAKGKGRPKGSVSLLPKVRELLGEEIAEHDPVVRETIQKCLRSRDHVLAALTLHARTNRELEATPAVVLLAERESEHGAAPAEPHGC